MTQPLDVIREKQIPGCLTATLLSNGIIEVKWDEDLDEIKKEHLVQLKDFIRDLGEGKKMPVYFSFINFLNINNEAREYASSTEGEEFTLANAIYVDNLAKKILFNFFINFNKPNNPTKAFGNRVDAFIWLEKFNPKNKNTDKSRLAIFA